MSNAVLTQHYARRDSATSALRERFEPMNRSADYFGAVNWRKGCLTPYMSMPALGAHYCNFNDVDPRAFINLMKGLLPRDPLSNGKIPAYVGNVPCSVDVPGFALHRFAKMLDEPSRLIRTQSQRPFLPVDRLGRKAWYAWFGSDSALFSSLRGCQQCLRSGYHSLLHQVPYMGRCFIHHQTLLENYGPTQKDRSALPLDLRALTPLYKLWFSADAQFCQRGSPASLSKAEIERAVDSAHYIRNQLTLISKEIKSETYPPSPYVPDLVTDLQLQGKFMEVRYSGVHPHRPDYVYCSPSLIANSHEWAGLGEEFALLCAARMLECSWSDERIAIWQHAAASTRADMHRYHHDCKYELERVVKRPVWATALRGLSPASGGVELQELSLLHHHMLPCHRLLAVRLWDEICRMQDLATSPEIHRLWELCEARRPYGRQGIVSNLRYLRSKKLVDEVPWRGTTSPDKRNGESLTPLLSHPTETQAGWTLMVPRSSLCMVVDAALMAAMKVADQVLHAFMRDLENGSKSRVNPLPELRDRLKKERVVVTILSWGKSETRAEVLASREIVNPKALPDWTTSNASIGEHWEARERLLMRLEETLRRYSRNLASTVHGLPRNTSEPEKDQ